MRLLSAKVGQRRVRPAAGQLLPVVQNRIVKYGYARVSTDGQSVDAHVRQLQAEGCDKVLREVASGAKTDRRQFRRAIEQIAAGSVLMVTRLDRLARSARDLLNTLAEIAAKEAGFRSPCSAASPNSSATWSASAPARGASSPKRAA
jgi:predicted site-specific integrase-resolvase